VHEDPETTESVDDDAGAPKPIAYCFIGEDRVCGPDCMAYTSMPADVTHLDPQQRHCVVLVSVERLARHSAIGVKIVGDMMSFMRKSDADSRRTEQKPPATPR